MAVLVRINAQIPPIEEALARAGIPYRAVGVRFHERPEVRQARPLLRRSRLKETGALLPPAVRRLFEQRLGFGDESAGQGNEARERIASLELLLSHPRRPGEGRPGHGPGRIRGGPRAAGRSRGGRLGRRREPADLPPRQGPRMGRGLPAGRWRKACCRSARPRRRTRSPRNGACSTWGSRERACTCGSRGRSSEPARAASRSLRQPSRFLIAAGAARQRVGSARPAQTALTFTPSPDPSRDRDARLLERLQLWRRERAKADLMPAYVIAHDATLLAIAEAEAALGGRAPPRQGHGPDQGRALRRRDHRGGQRRGAEGLLGRHDGSRQLSVPVRSGWTRRGPTRDGCTSPRVRQWAIHGALGHGCG